MPDVQMDYDAVEQLSRAFGTSVQDLNQTETTVMQIAAMIDGGALVTQRGQQWSEFLRTAFIPRLRRLMDSLDEVSRDLDGAVRELRDGDTSAHTRFGG